LKNDSTVINYFLLVLYFTAVISITTVWINKSVYFLF